MTDQYYEQEDEVQETPETALANFQAQSNAMVHFVPETAEDLDRSGQMLRKLWEDAGAQGNTGAQEMINHLWDIEQRQANKVVQLDAARQAAIAALQHIDEKYTQAVAESKQTKDAIQEAIEYGSTDNPLIGELIDSVREGTEEEYLGGLYLECPGCTAMSTGWFDNLSHDAVNDLCYVLFSSDYEDVPLPLREELAKNINSFAEQWNAHLNMLRQQKVERIRAEELLDEDEDEGEDE